MRREQILLIAVLAVLGLMAFLRFMGDATHRSPATASLPLDLVELGPADPVADLGAEFGRDPFREPREEEPLPPLDLPLPPVGELAAVLPPPVPDSGADHWSDHLLRNPEPLPGEIDQVLDVGGESADGAEEGGDSGIALSRDANYEAIYDWVRVDPITRFYGRLLGEDRYDKQPGDVIGFQEVDPRSGEDRFAPRTFEPDQYETFGFAKTLRNEIELAVRKVSDSPGALPQRIERVRWLLDQGTQEPVAFEYAVELAREGVQHAPDDVEAWMALGEAWERTFHLDEAFALYAGMAGVPLPGDAPSLDVGLEPGRFRRYSAPQVRMAVILERFGLRDEAEQLLRDAVALADGDPLAPLEYGRLLLETGRLDAARDQLERATGMHASRSDADALRNGLALGRCELAAGRWDEALRTFSETRRAAAGSPLAARLAAGEVAAHYLSGAFDRALGAAREAVAEFGPLPQLLYLRGIAAAAAGEPAGDVVRDLRGAASAWELDAAPALAALAFWLEVQGHPEESANALADALQMDPELPYAIYLRGRRAAREGDLQAAETDMRALLGAAPHFAAGLLELGWVLHRDGRFDAAEVALRRATEDEPERADVHLRRGLNLLELGELDEGRAALATAQAIEPDLHVVRNALAWAANAEEDFQSAISELSFCQDVLREQPEHPQFLYAELWQGRLGLHYRKRSWTDPFDGRLLRPGWRTDARVGLEPRVLDGRLRLHGDHRGAGLTRVSREVPGASFISFAGDVEVGPEHRGEAGIQLSLERGRRGSWEFRVYRDREGTLRWMLQQGPRLERGEAGRAPTGTPMRIRAELDREPTPPVLTVTVDGRKVYSEGAPALRSASLPLLVGVYAETANALPVEVSLDDVELVFLVNP